MKTEGKIVWQANTDTCRHSEIANLQSANSCSVRSKENKKFLINTSISFQKGKLLIVNSQKYVMKKMSFDFKSKQSLDKLQVNTAMQNC